MTIENVAEELEFQEDSVLDLIEKLAEKEGVDPLFWIERATVWFLNIEEFLFTDGAAVALHVADEEGNRSTCKVSYNAVDGG